MKKKLIVFDLDGTLAETKQKVSVEMKQLLKDLMINHYVSIISGGDWPQFEKQLLSDFDWSDINVSNLVLLPTCGSKYYQFINNEWTLVYSESLSVEERKRIINSFEDTLKTFDLNVSRTWGPQLEDRDTQITFSVLGQQAPASEKEQWASKNNHLRKQFRDMLEVELPEYSIRLGGATSIDITRRGIDKAFGIRKLCEKLNVTTGEILFVGDALFPEGNDYPVKEMGVVSIQVNSVSDTSKIIETILAYQ